MALAGLGMGVSSIEGSNPPSPLSSHNASTFLTIGS